MSDFTQLIDLASERLGGSVVFANDDFFAPKENLIKPAEPVWIEGKYTDDGKWMDGWETRRRRSPRLNEAYDWCIIRLGYPGEIEGIVVDTAYFKGNYPSHCALDVTLATGIETDHVEWKEVLPLSELAGDSKNNFAIKDTGRVTHVRLRIYPDGGVARLRVHGNVLPDWEELRSRNSEIDLAAAENGGDVADASDEFFGHRRNLIMPGFPRDMSEGWETRRRRGEGFDWCIVKLGALGTITRVEIDTSFFKGNYPESCLLEGALITGDDLRNVEWGQLLPMTKLQAHSRLTVSSGLSPLGELSHVRFKIFPDGGVSRLRLYGRLS